MIVYRKNGGNMNKWKDELILGNDPEYKIKDMQVVIESRNDEPVIISRQILKEGHLLFIQ